MKTLVTAVDAATAENPVAAKSAPNGVSRHAAGPSAGTSASPGVPPRDGAYPLVSDTAARKAPQPAAKTVAQAQSRSQTREAKQRLGRGGKRFGDAVWKPFLRLSGVLWLEVTGVFFGLFAFVALTHLWKLRAAWHAGAADAAHHRSLLGAAIMFVLFGYFCVSSFLRARRRERRR